MRSLMRSQQIKILLVAAALAAIAIIIPNTNSFVVLLVTRALAFSILVMSLDLLLGFTGLASLGQAAYLGVGAYMTAILATKFQFGLGYDFWLAVVLGILAGAALAAIFGLLAIRATGVYFLMITLALGQCVWGLAYRWNSLTGGDNGINLRNRPKFGIDLSHDVTFFYLVFGFFAVSLLAMYVLVQSPFGRSLAGIRERELRMQILGYNTWLHKYIAFVIAGGFGELAGVLWAHTAGIVSPENVVLTTSVDALLMVVLGGAGTLVGGVIGAFIVFGLREYLSTLVPWWQYLLGGVYVATILYLPSGLMGIAERIRQRRAKGGKTLTGVPAYSNKGHLNDDGGRAMTSNLLRGLIPVLFGGCLAFGMSSTAGAQQEELRIGFLAPTTGIFAQVGKDMVDGFQMYLDEVKNDFAGAKVRLIVEDEQGKPDTAVTKARKLVLQDKVQMFVGGLLASTGYALAPVSTKDSIYISPVAAADDLTQRDLAKFPYFIRTGWTSSQPSHPFGQWACDQGYKKIVAIGADYAFGYEVVGGFQKAFEACGGQIIQKIWPPLGTKDFGPYIPTMKQDADAIFSLMVGPMSLQFPKQLAAAGNKKPVIGGGTSYDEFVLPSMGDEVIGHVSALQYSAAIDTPKNAEFVKKYRTKYGKVPSYYSESNYTTAQMIHEVMNQNKGKWPGGETSIKQLNDIKVNSPRRPVSIDEMRNPVQNIYIKKVEKKKMFGYDKEELWNTVIKTYPNVGQFGQFNKAEYLKQPLYNRDVPACKYC